MTFGVRMNPSSTGARWANTSHRIARGPGTLYRKLQSLKFLATRDRRAVAEFLSARYPHLPSPLSLMGRLTLLSRYLRITHAVRGYHTLAEILTVTDAILRRPNPVVVEAGSGSGSSTAKLSLATSLAGGRLYVFDSFQGIPDNDEDHHLLDGRPLRFRRGAFRGRLSAVKKRVEAYGAIEVCTFEKGLFAETLPKFQARADVILLDVDLASSTRTCLQHLYPKLSAGGVLFSQDGHIRETREILADVSFWRHDVGVEPPTLNLNAADKLLEIQRPARLEDEHGPHDTNAAIPAVKASAP